MTITDFDMSIGKGSLTDEEYKVIINRTADDIHKIQAADCKYCKYYLGGGPNGTALDGYCNYLTEVGSMRPCLAGECRKAGVFADRSKTEPKKKRLTAKSG